MSFKIKNIRVIHSLSEMSEYAVELQRKGIRLGLVPTMGALHDGHLSLLRLLDDRCGIKAVSIFVNPIQFGEGEDFGSYPRNEENDLALLAEAGCELVFAPNVNDMYPYGFQTYVNVEELSKPLCGQYRPEHFRGVATIVLRLFNLTQCLIAAFGLKDYQQAMVIKRMVNDLNLAVELIFGETVREKDGLALSSRNAFLKLDERELAKLIPQSLNWAKNEAVKGETNCSRILKGMAELLQSKPGIKIQYLEAVNPDTLKPQDKVQNGVQVLLAVYIGKTRLIDNIRVNNKLLNC
ncbi:MAG: pantoate--beta-alanine ligase [Candidatus Hatepunaea meridiana]|nr:pantoate--beta-alanine ligase [Candidatus Hatepunaea meridiana]